MGTPADPAGNMLERLSDPTAQPETAGGGWHASVREHAAELRRWTRRLLGGDEGLDDVMQEVALATVKSEHRPEQAKKIMPWLKAVARHKVQDHWRKIERERRLHDQVAVAHQSPSPSEWVLGCDHIETVREALASLPAADRQLLAAKYTDGKSYGEIAGAAGITIKALEYRLGKARDQLRLRLEKLNRETDQADKIHHGRNHDNERSPD